jgi:hypothetical protein
LILTAVVSSVETAAFFAYVISCGRLIGFFIVEGEDKEALTDIWHNECADTVSEPPSR